MKESIRLFLSENDCCACGACLNICPKNAITFKANTYGFSYPVINNSLCIQCGACLRACKYQGESEMHSPKYAYAVFNSNHQQLMNSSSGGAFAAFASYILQKKGYVYGATLEKKDECFLCHHINISSIDDLPRLQGSKYVHSDSENSYKEAKKLLQNGQIVLYSGTPCQIDALYGFLGKRYDNLYTVDVICHGVPGLNLFNDYINHKKNKGLKMDGCLFRDKQQGWKNFFLKIYYGDSNKLIWWRLSSYYYYFIKGYTYRPNCYSCKYACKDRVSDLTIGDYWGIEQQHPELFVDKKWNDQIYDGISCVLVNTPHGKDLFDHASQKLVVVESTVEKVRKYNGQLNQPTIYNEEGKKLMALYAQYGYVAVEKHFVKEMGKLRILKYKMKCIMPTIFKRKVKQFFFVLNKRKKTC